LRYTDQHPSVIHARARIAEAQADLKRAQAAVPPDVETAIAPKTEADRNKLEQELARLDAQIAAEQKRGSGKSSKEVDATTNWVVQLETEHARLRRTVTE